MKQETLANMLGIICSVFEAYSAVLFLAEKPGDSPARLAGSFSLGDKVDLDAVIEPGKGLVGWIARNGEPLIVPNFDQRRSHLGYYRDHEEERIKAFMGCPLPGGRGVLCIDSKRQYSFAEKDQKLLHLFSALIAQLAGAAVEEQADAERLRYYQSLKIIYVLRRQHSRWAEFLDQLLCLLAETAGCSYAVFCVTDEAGDSYATEGENRPLIRKRGPRSFPLSSGAIGWVFRNDAPLMSGGSSGLPDASLFGKGAEIPQFQTIMALPVIIQRRTRGVLCLANDVPMPVSEECKEFLRMASEHLALFLENLYVKCRLRDVCQGLSTQAGPPNVQKP